MPRWLKWLIALALGGAMAGGIGFFALLWHYEHDPTMPKLDQLGDYHPKVVTRIYSANGKLLGELYKERRTVVPIAEIPKLVRQAFIAAEDAEFEHHQGVDYPGMVRALVKLVWSRGHTQQGASTITQQVVKTFLLSPERTMSRKAREIVLARRLERRFKKDEILHLYLNQIYFGHGRYGVEEAARFYFGKSIRDVGVAEAALLAALPKAPEDYSPIKAPDKAKRRRDGYVLPQMVKVGAITQAQADQSAALPLGLVAESGREKVGIAPEVIDLVRETLEKRHGKGKVWELGLDVRTTIDSALEEAAREALEVSLRELDARHGYRKPVRRYAPPGARKGKKGEDPVVRDDDAGLAQWMKKQRAELGKQLDGAPSMGRIYEALVTAVDDKEGTLAVELAEQTLEIDLDADDRYNPEKKKPGQRFRRGDVVRVRVVEAAQKEQAARAVLEGGPQGAFLALDPQTREVKAIVGGYGFQAGGFDRVVRARRQPGSSFKPYVYGAAIEGGRFTAASIVNDSPEVFALWKPHNSHAEFRGPIRLRPALAASINTVAIKVLSEVGVDAVRTFAKKVGIGSEVTQDLSIALGSSVVTPWEHINAYATFASGGRLGEPVLVRSIGPEQLAPPEQVQALRPEVAYVLTSMMSSVVTDGTARAALKLGRPLSGKTGTSNGGKDAWFVGFSPDLVAGAWVGFDDMRPLGRGEEGAKAALPIWIRFMQKALGKRPPAPFSQPPGVVVQRIDPRSGLLAREGATDAIEEVFVEGTAPTEVAPEAGQAPEDYLESQFGDATTTAAEPPAEDGKPRVDKPKKRPPGKPLTSGESELTE